MLLPYHAVQEDRRFLTRFGILPTAGMGSAAVGPGQQGIFVRRPRAPAAEPGRVPHLEAVSGRWGLIPLFSKDGEDLFTCEAASESAATERNFLQPWKRRHRCVILVDALFEVDGGSGSLMRVRQADGGPLCVAGLWNAWRSPAGECVESFAMLTLAVANFDGTRRRGAAILQDAWVDEWFASPVEETAAFLRPYPAHMLSVSGVSEDAGRAQVAVAGSLR